MTQMCGTVSLAWVHEARRMLGGLSSLEAAQRTAPGLVPAFRFLYHERHSRITKSGAFVVTRNGVKRKIDGLTKQLAETFHPFPLNISTGGQKTGGSARGGEVDLELASLINTGQIPQRRDSDGAPMPPSLNNFTRRALEKLSEEKLQPVMAQVNVYDDEQEMELATALDMICIDWKVDLSKHPTNLVNVQLKTGFDLNYNKKGEPFYSLDVEDSELTRIHQSHANLHQLQVAMEHAIVQTRYGRPLHRSVVLVVTSTDATIYPLQSKFRRTLIIDIYRNLRKRRSTSSWERAKQKTKAQEAYKKAKSGTKN